MNDIELLMGTVSRLQSQGVNVLDLLGGNSRQPSDANFNGMDVSDFPVPEMKPFTGPGPGAVVDDFPRPKNRSLFDLFGGN